MAPTNEDVKQWSNARVEILSHQLRCPKAIAEMINACTLCWEKKDLEDEIVEAKRQISYCREQRDALMQHYARRGLYVVIPLEEGPLYFLADLSEEQQATIHRFHSMWILEIYRANALIKRSDQRLECISPLFNRYRKQWPLLCAD